MAGYLRRRHRLLRLWTYSVACFCLLASQLAGGAQLPLCLYVSSYHSGNTWSDALEQALRKTLEGRCEIASFYMDTIRRRSKVEMEQSGQAAFELVRTTQPDIIITSDDNAAKYLLRPYLIGIPTPVVFAGINWTVEEYGLPADNVTGIVEVTPIQSMLNQTLHTMSHPLATRANSPALTPGASRVLFLGTDDLSDRKRLSHLELTLKSYGTGIDSVLVDNFDAWRVGFDLAQDYDLLILGNNVGIKGWDNRAAMLHVQKNTRTLSVTNNEWMMAYSILGYTRVPEEQGIWAGMSVIAILDGLPVSEIPIVTNRRFETWLNQELLTQSEITLDPLFNRNAKKYY